MKAFLLTTIVLAFATTMIGGSEVALWLWLQLRSANYHKVSLQITKLNYSEGPSDRSGSRGHLIASGEYLNRPIKFALKDMKYEFNIKSQRQAEHSPLLGKFVDIYVDDSYNDRAVLFQGRTAHSIESGFFENGSKTSTIVFVVSLLVLLLCAIMLRLTTGNTPTNRKS